MTRPLFLAPGRGGPVAPGALLGEGAMGKVHRVAGLPRAAAKVYHPDRITAATTAKIAAMLAKPPALAPLGADAALPQVAWPERALYDEGGRIAGFLMPLIDFEQSTSLVNLLQRSSRRVEGLPEHYGYRILVARNLAAVVAELHRAGHHVIDLKPANLRFYRKTGYMALVDTDGFSIAGATARLPAEHVSDEFIAPEAWQRPPSTLGEPQDRFALGVIVFQLLNNGLHPFAGVTAGARGDTDLQSRIVRRLYAYGLGGAGASGPSLASVHEHLPRATRALFDQAMLNADRPSAAEWRDHLQQLLDRLEPCAAKPDEHQHLGLGCGFCAHEGRKERLRVAARKRREASVLPAAVRSGTRAPLLRPSSPSPAPPWLSGRPLPPPPSRWQLVAARHRAGFALAAVLIAVLGYAAWDLAGDGAAPSLRFTASRAIVAGGEPAAPVPPRAYYVLPPSAARTAPLRAGPGKSYDAVGQLAATDEVVGMHRSLGDDGAIWIDVQRLADGARGYVPEAAVIEQAPSQLGAPTGTCTTAGGWSDRQICGNPDLAGEVDALDARVALIHSLAGEVDRTRLQLLTARWPLERDRCRDTRVLLGCLRDTIAAQSRGLERWWVASGSLAPPASPPGPT